MEIWPFSIPRTFAIVYSLLMIGMGEACAQSISQKSSGSCSPNVANVTGNVVFNFNCPGFTAADLRKALSQGGDLAVKNVKAEDLGAGSLLVSAETKNPNDPAYPALLAMSTAATTTSFYANLDTVLLTPTAQSLLANLAAKLLALHRPLIIVISGFWANSCTAIDRARHCVEWMSNVYSDRVSLHAASIVKTYLIERGIPYNCIYTEGRGNRDPITTEPSNFRSLPAKDINRWVAINRRIQIELALTNEKECQI
ncbi:OmpA family protein [Paraburkholderia sp. J8-2]|uniref:OmpA family protein n=1 Tax=Paraburkholderia sp. J8-2 TaxID=2805440 RepID=UPI002AB70D35|nr:OmpA family protein [Paraburkholderia sp. J8-2]